MAKASPKPAKAPKSVDAKLDDALRLMDYAIDHNLVVPKKLIEGLEKARIARERTDSAETGLAVTAVATNVDVALSELTAITFPTTAETLNATSGDTLRNLFVAIVVMMTALLILGIVSYGQVARATPNPTATPTAAPTAAPSSASLPTFAAYKTATPRPNSVGVACPCGPEPAIWRSLLAVSLGGFGALFYIAFNLIGALKEQAFNANDWTTHVMRFMLGMAIGWIFSVTIATDPTNKVMLFLPFLGGFSTRLVVGIINQAIQAVELTLGLDSKNAELQRRRARAARQTGPAPPAP